MDNTVEAHLAASVSEMLGSISALMQFSEPSRPRDDALLYLVTHTHELADELADLLNGTTISLPLALRRSREAVSDETEERSAAPRGPRPARTAAARRQCEKVQP